MADDVLQLGESVNLSTQVFRAFSEKAHRKREQNGCKTKARAFYRNDNDTDGVSLGLTEMDAVARLRCNYGYGQLLASGVADLGRDLQVRLTPDTPGHAVITNVPFINGSDEDRERAILLAGELARITDCVSCDELLPLREET